MHPAAERDGKLFRPSATLEEPGMARPLAPSMRKAKVPESSPRCCAACWPTEQAFSSKRPRTGSQVRNGLAAGGRWIRTLGPRLSSATSMSRERVLVAGKMTFRGDDLDTATPDTSQAPLSVRSILPIDQNSNVVLCSTTTQTLNGTSPPREAHSRSVETIDRARPRANSSSRPCATFTTSPVDRWAGRKRTYPDHDDWLH